MRPQPPLTQKNFLSESHYQQLLVMSSRLVTPSIEPEYDGRRKSLVKRHFLHEMSGYEPKAILRHFSSEGFVSFLDDICCKQVKGWLRCELTNDVDGWWLRPHLDIKRKYFNIMVYLGDEGDGTEFYTNKTGDDIWHTEPWEANKAMITIGHDQGWHGWKKKPIKDKRRSFLINCVDYNTGWRLR